MLRLKGEFFMSVKQFPSTRSVIASVDEKKLEEFSADIARASSKLDREFSPKPLVVTSPDAEEGNKHYVAALTELANDGNPKAQSELGRIYFFGNRGVLKDENRGVSWLRKAGDQGEASAQCFMGEACYYGWGSPDGENAAGENDGEAFFWFQRSARSYFELERRRCGVCECCCVHVDDEQEDEQEDEQDERD